MAPASITGAHVLSITPPPPAATPIAPAASAVVGRHLQQVNNRNGDAPSMGGRILRMDNGNVIRAYQAGRKQAEDVLKVTTSLIKECQDAETVLHLLDNVRRASIALGVPSYGAAVARLNRLQAFEQAVHLYEQMRTEQLSPDPQLATALMTAYWHCERPEAAQTVFEQIRSRLPADADHSSWRPAANALLDGFASRGQAEQAQALFDRLFSVCPTQLCPPDRVSHNTLLKAYANGGYPKPAQSLFLRLLQQGHRPDLMGCNTLLSAYAKAGWGQRALELFDMMSAEPANWGLPRPDRGTCNTVLRALAQAGAAAAAGRVFDWLCQAHARGHCLAPDRFTYQDLLKAYGRAGWAQQAQQIIAGLEQSTEVHPDLRMYQSLMLAYARARQPERAQALLQRLQHQSQQHPELRPDRALYNTALLAWTESGQWARAQSLLQTMTEQARHDQRLAPDIATYGIVLQGLCQAKQTERAIQMFQWLCTQARHTAQLRPNPIVYASLINLFEHIGQPQRSLQLFQQGLEARLLPPSLGYAATDNILYFDLRRVFGMGSGRKEAADAPVTAATARALLAWHQQRGHLNDRTVMAVSSNGDRTDTQDAVIQALSLQGRAYQLADDGRHCHPVSAPPAG